MDVAEVQSSLGHHGTELTGGLRSPTSRVITDIARDRNTKTLSRGLTRMSADRKTHNGDAETRRQRRMHHDYSSNLVISHKCMHFRQAKHKDLA
jgi:hypothetical protein